MAAAMAGGDLAGLERMTGALDRARARTLLGQAPEVLGADDPHVVALTKRR